MLRCIVGFAQFNYAQQVTLDMSAGNETILNARRVRFAHLQRKDYFIFASVENLRIFPACFFTGGRYQKWHFFR